MPHDPQHVGHAAFVEAWLDRTADSLPSAQLVTLFERALAALWLRAQATLGEVTLKAIVDRVLDTASEKYPVLSTLQIAGTGVRFDELREQAAAQDAAHLSQAVRFTLVELLTVVGHLTDEILTPALHAELSKVRLEERGRTDDEGKGATP